MPIFLLLPTPLLAPPRCRKNGGGGPVPSRTPERRRSTG
ncbi:hypothetical protein GSS87_07795 [Corynebacterium sp. 4HC-13]|nr:hypothetical protein [Corynebacterium anserum]